jgi:DNA-binding transcriptional MerR regulator
MNNNKIYSIGEFAKLTSNSIRTLHYYDEIGLLKAHKNPSSGHREYNISDIAKLQKIVTFKLLGYSLEQIIPLLERERFDTSLRDTLLEQKHELEAQKARIDTALKAINRAAVLLEDNKEVDRDILLSIIHSIQTEKEQREWLEQYVAPETVSGLFDRPEKEMEQLDSNYVDLVREVKRLVGTTPVDSPEVQKLIDEQMKMNLGFVGTDSFEQLAPLAELDEVKLKELEAMVTSPFTQEEEAWLQAATEYYMKQNGLD